VTFAEFQQAWEPPAGEVGRPTRLAHAQRIDDPRELVTIGFADLPAEQLEDELARIAEVERGRHEQIAEVIDETRFRRIYEVVADLERS
jgi:hypothetical protein